MADLPTCWYCPECGEAYTGDLGERDAEELISGGHWGSNGPCAGEFVVAPVIPPGTPLTDVLDALGHTYREALRCPDCGEPFNPYGENPEGRCCPCCVPLMKGRPVLVVDNPAPAP